MRPAAQVSLEPEFLMDAAQLPYHDDHLLIEGRRGPSFASPETLLRLATWHMNWT